MTPSDLDKRAELTIWPARATVVPRRGARSRRCAKPSRLRSRRSRPTTPGRGSSPRPVTSSHRAGSRRIPARDPCNSRGDAGLAVTISSRCRCRAPRAGVADRCAGSEAVLRGMKIRSPAPGDVGAPGRVGLDGAGRPARRDRCGLGREDGSGAPLAIPGSGCVRAMPGTGAVVANSPARPGREAATRGATMGLRRRAGSADASHSPGFIQAWKPARHGKPRLCPPIPMTGPGPAPV